MPKMTHPCARGRKRRQHCRFRRPCAVKPQPLTLRFVRSLLEVAINSSMLPLRSMIPRRTCCRRRISSSRGLEPCSSKSSICRCRHAAQRCSSHTPFAIGRSPAFPHKPQDLCLAVCFVATARKRPKLEPAASSHGFQIGNIDEDGVSLFVVASGLSGRPQARSIGSSSNHFHDRLGTVDKPAKLGVDSGNRGRGVCHCTFECVSA